MRALTKTTRLCIALTAISLATAALTAAAGPATARSQQPAVSATTPAHSLDAARTHAAITLNSWQHDTLAHHAQQNWYRLRLTTRSYLYTVLGTLPADYNLRVYNEAGTHFTASDRTKKNTETVGRMLDPGTYFIRVGSTQGVNSRAKYSLMVRSVPATATLGILTAHVGTGGDVVGDVANVSDQWQYLVALDVKLYGRDGKVLYQQHQALNASSVWIALAPGARAPFDVILKNVPQSIMEKTVRVETVPWWATTTAKTPVSLTVSDVKRASHHRNGLTWVDYKATVHNTSSRNLRLVTPVVEARDDRGVLVGASELDWRRVPAHTTRNFSGTYYNWEPHLHFSVKAFETTDSVP